MIGLCNDCQKLDKVSLTRATLITLNSKSKDINDGDQDMQLSYVIRCLKKNWIILVAVVSALAVVGYYAYKHHLYLVALKFSEQAITSIPSPTDAVFAFDFNQVIVMADFAKIRSIFWEEVPILDALLFILNPLHWFDIIRAGIVKRRFEFILEELIRVYPKIACLQTLYFKLFRAVDLNTGMIGIIQDLKRKGYPCYILSDIGPKALASIMKKFPILRSLFDGYFLPTSADDMAKPDPLFYAKFKRYLDEQEHGSKQIIFIDNSADNVVAAVHQGFKGILFTTAESLAADLGLERVGYTKHS
jgi:FMN phosphatase YigB (HAD superfamily)